MRNGKVTFNFKIPSKMDSREFFLGLVLPFFLFWGGILTPIVTDSLLVWIFSLVPFYGFVIVSDNVLRGKIDRSTFVFSIFLSLVSSIFLVIILFSFPFENESYRTICRMGFINVVPSFMFYVFGGIDNIRGFGIFPIFTNGGN